MTEEEKEAIEKTFERNMEILSRRMIGTATEITIIEQPMILLFKDLIWRLEKQQKEIEKKDKIIGKMIDNIMTHYQVKTIRKMCCPTCKIGERACTYSGIHRDCIKRYFKRKAEV